MENKDYCTCPKQQCPLHGNCKACIIKHKNANQLSHCLFPNNNGDKSLENFYYSLKEIYEEKNN